MEGNLVIVESPAKAKTIQKFLGNDYIVKPSFGHIRDLQEKKMSVDVSNNFAPEYVIPADKKKTVSELKTLAAKAHTVWLASDEDREGEAISWHLAETLKLDPAKTHRIVFHEITNTAIQNAIKNPRTINMRLVDAQQARRVLDRLVGFELSPVLWKKIQPRLSAGRVQSVALRLVVDRENEILAFNSTPYYKVDALFHPKGTNASVKVKATLDTKFDNAADAQKFLQDSIGATFSISSIDAKEGQRNPAPPFTTSTLQQEAARKLHFPVSLTMKIAQSLYESGYITYMRTDSTNLSSLALNTAKEYINENYGENYSKVRQFQTKTKGAQEAHEAIRPTFIKNTTIEGTAQEQKLYDLIWKRTVASQMASAGVLNTSIKVASDKRSETFAIQASQILFDGFLKVYMEGTDDQDPSSDEVILPDLNTGDIMENKEITASCKFTQAAPRYSEATLVKKLEELGIGRPSTYAPTISTLTTERGYLVKGDKEGKKVQVTDYILKDSTITPKDKTETIGAEKGKLLPQQIGMIVTDFLVKNFSNIMDYDFTANVETEFDKIEEEGKSWTSVIGEFYSPFHTKIDETLSNGIYDHYSRELGVDPTDGQPLVAKFGQYGAFVQKGDGESKQYASLGKGQLIESITLEDALKLFQLPRTVGNHNGVDIIATKGKFGPYLKYGDKNIKLHKGKDPLSITLEDCIALIDESLSSTPVNDKIAEFTDNDIQIINGRYGPYIKHAGANYKIPAGKDAATLTEEDCLAIINSSTPTASKRGNFKKRTNK
ncbi:MAG: type I DNA topoisomerase [Bacteroidales bacterium]|nr:type I DNA topoisomerase [Bacteroidales bacterium]